MAKDKKKKNENIEEIEEVVETSESDEVEEYTDKEVTVMDMLNRIVVCLIIIAIILAINTIVLVCKKDGTTKSESTNTSEKSDSNSTPGTDEGGTTSSGAQFTCIDGYDSSMFEKVDLEGILDLFDSDGVSVLYIGRCDCGACAAYLPALQKAQEDYGFKTQYFDINYLDSKSDDFEKVQKKLTKKYTMNGQDGTSQTETFGYWIGYTPMTVIIKDGKQVDGEIGAIDYDTLAKMLENSGLSK